MPIRTRSRSRRRRSSGRRQCGGPRCPNSSQADDRASPSRRPARQRAEAVDEPGGDAAREDRDRDRPRQEGRPGLHGAVVAHVLEVERAEEEGRVHAGHQEAPDQVGRRCRASQDAQRHDRVLDPRLEGDERPIKTVARPPKPSTWARSSRGRGADDRVDGAHQRRGDEQRAQPVDAMAEPEPVVRGDESRPSASVARPIGTLTKKIQCQLSACVRSPPASRPSEPPATETNT